MGSPREQRQTHADEKQPLGMVHAWIVQPPAEDSTPFTRLRVELVWALFGVRQAVARQ